MPPTNEFESYASDPGANVVSLVTYDTSPTRLLGAVDGQASAPIANRAWRQSANMAAALGEAIIQKTVFDALDDGNILVLRNRIVAMIEAIAAALDPPGKAMATYFASGEFTVPAGVTRIRVRMVGGGGGAAGGDAVFPGGGGGAGSYLEGIYTVTPGAVLAIVVGAGGTGGAPAGGGETAGGASTIVALGLSVAGGAPGLHSSAPAGGDGGTFPDVGTVRVRGGAGTDASFGGSTAKGGGDGGASYFGGGGRASTVYNPTVQDGHAAGSGGGGGYGGGSVTGGAGAAGMVVIEY